jgi:hypothetical protein
VSEDRPGDLGREVPNLRLLSGFASPDLIHQRLLLVRFQPYRLKVYLPEYRLRLQQQRTQ